MPDPFFSPKFSKIILKKILFQEQAISEMVFSCFNQFESLYCACLYEYQQSTENSNVVIMFYIKDKIHMNKVLVHGFMEFNSFLGTYCLLSVVLGIGVKTESRK